MISFILYFLMGVGLSMDAFSLAIIYGTNGIKRKYVLVISLFVGAFHLLMPILGSLVGKYYLIHYIHDANIIVGIVFLIVAFEMISSVKKGDEQENKILNSKPALFLFPLTVSLDSFSVGIALGVNGENVFLAGVIFSIISALFTFGGLTLGKRLSEKYGKRACLIGGIILLLLGIDYIF